MKKISSGQVELLPSFPSVTEIFSPSQKGIPRILLLARVRVCGLPTLRPRQLRPPLDRGCHRQHQRKLSRVGSPNYRANYGMKSIQMQINRSSDNNEVKFCALFESGLKLAADDLSDGRASNADLRKTLKTPGTQTLISTIYSFRIILKIFLQN